jgi:predicted methyltransferase
MSRIILTAVVAIALGGSVHAPRDSSSGPNKLAFIAAPPPPAQAPTAHNEQGPQLARTALSGLAPQAGRTPLVARTAQSGQVAQSAQSPQSAPTAQSAQSAPSAQTPQTPPTAQPAQPARPAQAPARRRLFPPQDLGLLSAPDRDDWSKPDVIMDALAIADGAVVADLGAGGGWFTIRLARRVGPNGVVYAQDIQPQMIEAINKRVQQEGLSNVRTVLGTPTDPRLPGGVDAVLIVDAYHEMDDPLRPDAIQGLLRAIARALKPQGRVGIVDFLPGGGGPGPAAEDRVSPETIIAAVEASGLRLQSRENVPPFQYLLVFEKAAPPGTTPQPKSSVSTSRKAR